MPDKNQQSTQDESIESSLETIISHFTGKIFTTIPGKIEKIYDLNNNRLVDVQPTIMNRILVDGDSTPIEYPVFPRVPIFIQGTEDFYTSYPVKVGNPCMLHFIQHSNDLYLKSDGKTVVDPNNLRKHDPNDAFCTIGNILPGFSIPGISPDDMVMGKVDDSVKIIITHDGKVDIKANRVNLGDVSASKALALSEKVADNFNSFQTAFNTHTHVCVSVGSPCAVAIPDIATVEDTASSKVFTDS